MPENTNSLSLIEALRTISRRLNSSSTFSLGKLGILSHLARHGRATTTELAAIIRVTPQAVSLVAREFEGLVLLERAPDAEDRRRIWIEMTDEGRKRLAQERAAGLEWLETAILTRLTQQEQQALESLIPLLRELEPEARDA
ncbi:MarR family transcriptional regulator [Paeniglutamicibacter gangotriensis]|uniref:MarR family transcriptional regulator n=1 Tax=Paeniglutamicibacter gangotriensis TaxID=254787 RepID=A0A5B0ECW4_9MICC|nr:MarR family transcriptional regulator [Paeniglutamicibacter gangotriensis]KAA0976065.1 MarR family transcriptional regulator [Paeniglutamicibacter gangotriensis]